MVRPRQPILERTLMINIDDGYCKLRRPRDPLSTGVIFGMPTTVDNLTPDHA
jgi:hypothetical protein